MDIVLKMLFLTLDNIEINFLDQKLNCRLSTTIEAFLTTK